MLLEINFVHIILQKFDAEIQGSLLSTVEPTPPSTASLQSAVDTVEETSTGNSGESRASSTIYDSKEETQKRYNLHNTLSTILIFSR